MQYNDLTKGDTVYNHVKRVDELATMLLDFHRNRERTYQMSFAKRGFVGVFMNLVRKTDRMDAVAQTWLEAEGQLNGTVLVDTLVDTAIYSLKWLALIWAMEQRTDTNLGLHQWLVEVFCPETGTDVRQLLKELYPGQEEEDDVPQEQESIRATEYRNPRAG
jgi:hypothetical protein